MKRLALLGMFALLLAPVWFLFTGSLQDIRGVFIMPPQLFPSRPTLENYRWLFDIGIGRWAINTVLVVVSSAALAVVSSTGAGYVFAFFRFRMKTALWLVLLLGIMIPHMSMIVPLFVVVSKIGLSGTLAAAVLPSAYMPVGIYLARMYFETVPASLLESARIDGANEAVVLRRVVVPMSAPIVTAVALFSAIASLGNYLWQMLQLQDAARQTLLVGLVKETFRRGGEVGLVNHVGRSLAVGVVLMVPLLVVFFSANRYFVTALGGAVKE